MKSTLNINIEILGYNKKKKRGLVMYIFQIRYFINPIHVNIVYIFLSLIWRHNQRGFVGNIKEPFREMSFFISFPQQTP